MNGIELRTEHFSALIKMMQVALGKMLTGIAVTTLVQRAGVVAVLGIELIAAAQGCDFLMPLRSSVSLEAVRRTVRELIPTLEDDRYFHPDLEAANGLIRQNAIVTAVPVELPGVA